MHSGSRQLTFHDLETGRACRRSGGISIFLLDQSSRVPRSPSGDSGDSGDLHLVILDLHLVPSAEESMEESRHEETDASGSINQFGIDRDDSVSDTRILPSRSILHGEQCQR